MPWCQELERRGKLRPVLISRDAAYRGEYSGGKYLVISHRWMKPDAPDEDGEQTKALKRSVHASCSHCTSLFLPA